MANRPLSGRSFLDQHVHVVLSPGASSDSDLEGSSVRMLVLVSECSFPNPRVLVSEAEFPNPRARLFRGPLVHCLLVSESAVLVPTPRLQFPNLSFRIRAFSFRIIQFPKPPVLLRFRIGLSFRILVSESSFLVSESVSGSFRIRGYSFRICGFSFRILVSESACPLVSESAVLVSESTRDRLSVQDRADLNQGVGEGATEDEVKRYEDLNARVVHYPVFADVTRSFEVMLGKLKSAIAEAHGLAFSAVCPY